MNVRAVAAVLTGAALASCAPPAVTLYVLRTSVQPGAETALGPHAVVIAVARVRLPDDLDTQDILVRRGSVLDSSHTGRWASRLSLGATDLLTGRLAESRPDTLVTDQPETASPSYRILINVSRLDLAAEGNATLEADWTIVSLNPAVPVQRDRARIMLTGPVGSDSDVVALTSAALTRLAAAIDITRLH